MNALTIAIFSLSLFCLMGLFLMVKQVRDRRALRWWQAQQIDASYQESEHLRNQTLQSLFGIRRQLEQMEMGSTIEPRTLDRMTIEPILAEVQQCQQDLTHLSDRLFSAYDFESLPLALKEIWHDLGEEMIPFEVQGTIEPIPKRQSEPYSPEDLMNYQLLLACLRQLLRTGLTTLELEHVQISLVSGPVSGQNSSWQDFWKNYFWQDFWQSFWQKCLGSQPDTQFITIQIQFDYQKRPDSDRDRNPSTVQLIAQMMFRLMPGRCSFKQRENCLNCYLYWPLASPS